MTRKELAEKYNIAETTIKSNFPRVEKQILKHFGVKIVREGRGNKTNYVEQIILVSDNRAENIFQAVSPLSENAGIIESDLNLESFAFKIFIGILTTPMLVFRGTEENLLKYLNVSQTQKNKEALREALETLLERNIILLIKNKDVMIIAIERNLELDLKLGTYMILNCKQMADKYKLKDWICLLKVWAGVQLIQKEETYTSWTLGEITNLSPYRIDQCRKILEEEKVFSSHIVYYNNRKGEIRCAGRETTIGDEHFFKINEDNPK